MKSVKKNFSPFVRVICNLPCDYYEGEIVKESGNELWLQEFSGYHKVNSEGREDPLVGKVNSEGREDRLGGNLYKIPFTSISTIESIGGYHE